MATASRQRVTVDLRGAADRLHSFAAARHMTTAAVVRMAIRQALDGQVGADSTVTQPSRTLIDRATIKVTIRLAPESATALVRRAHAADVSQGTYVACERRSGSALFRRRGRGFGQGPRRSGGSLGVKGLQARSRSSTRAGFKIRGPRPQSIAMSARENAATDGACEEACRVPLCLEFDSVDIHPARFFLCARCFVQVELCRQCDRGQIYCGQVCSVAARRERQREAGRRYQRSARGRATHAARARRWREARRPVGGDVSVTHQGPPEARAEAGEEPWAAKLDTGGSIVLGNDAGRGCRRCSCPLGFFVRQGFLRHRPHVRTRPRGEAARPGAP